MGVFSQYGRGIVPETGRTRQDRAEWVRPGFVEFNVIVNPVFMSETSASRPPRTFAQLAYPISANSGRYANH